MSLCHRTGESWRARKAADLQYRSALRLLFPCPEPGTGAHPSASLLQTGAVSYISDMPKTCELAAGPDITGTLGEVYAAFSATGGIRLHPGTEKGR
jgi:hypothetical protein